jgi:hypothetical protein
MPIPRLRVTVQSMVVAVAAIALGLFVVQEFWDGLPPRSVVRGIPGRIDRLRPGMSWEQAREVLGLEKSWIWRGTGARFAIGEGNGHYMHEVYHVRPPRIVVRIAQVGGGNPAPVRFYQSTAVIQVWFRTDIWSGMQNWRRDKSTRLVRATFSCDSSTIAEMPRSR